MGRSIVPRSMHGLKGNGLRNIEIGGGVCRNRVYDVRDFHDLGLVHCLVLVKHVIEARNNHVNRHLV